MMDDGFLASLAAIIGQKHVETDPAAMAGWLAEPRGLYNGQALALVSPGSTAEVAAVLAQCHAHDVAVTPQGGNTGLVGGQVPRRDGLLLSLRRLDRIRDVDASANAMIVEAGVTLARAQAAAASADRLFPLSLASEGSCTIGGNLATNAGGTAVLAYGSARDLTLGLEVALADGRVLPLLSKLRKDNTGYDLKHIFMGAEGTLGVITAASLKLFARPTAVETAFIGLASPKAALELLRLTQTRAGGALKTFELMPRIGIDFVLRHRPQARDPLTRRHEWHALIELADAGAHGLAETLTGILEAGMAQGCVEDAAIAASQAQRDAFWALREDLSEVQRLEGGSIKHDISVPIALIPEFLDEVSAAVAQRVPGARMVPFGHLGDGNIHCNVSQPTGADKAAFLARWEEVNALVHGMVARYGGSISAEHGIGQLKRELLREVKDKVALDVMRGVKALLDPKGILNPGKVI